MTEKLIDELSSFIIDGIYGFQISLYKSVPLDILSNTSMIFSTAPIIHNKYFNYIYQALIKKNDETINEKFQDFGSYSDHGTRCILNVIANTSLMFNLKLDTTITNFESEDTYSTTIVKQLNNMLPDIKKELHKVLDHECSGENICPNDEFSEIFNFEVSYTN